MKFNYFGYSVFHEHTDAQYLIDLRSFFRAFASHNDPAFKNLFSYNGERVYLINVTDDFYLFVQTKAEELIKKIDSSSIAVSDIEHLLSSNESIGFASYVFVERYHLAFGYKLLSPRSTCFSSFVNMVFARIRFEQFKFKLTALTGSSTREEALNFAYYGPTHIQVASNHSIVGSLMQNFGANLQDFSDLDSVEIIFKPRPRKDMTRVARKVISSLDLNGVDKFTVKAKTHAADHMIDLHLEGEGQLFDRINEKDEFVVRQILEDRMVTNSELQLKVRAHEEDTAFNQIDLNIFAGWDSRSFWATRLSGVQMP